MRIEIRDLGDDKSIALYTEDMEVYRKLRRSSRCWNIVPYWQKEKHRLDEKLVGIDLYFNKTDEDWLIRVINPKEVTFS